jgi:hypothetical protein
VGEYGAACGSVSWAATDGAFKPFPLRDERPEAMRVTATAAEAVGERLAGERVPRRRALVAALVAGTVTAVVVYRLLRAG